MEREADASSDLILHLKQFREITVKAVSPEMITTLNVD
jgi:hypothetical protein